MAPKPQNPELEEEDQAKPDVIAGDEIFFEHPKVGAVSGKVFSVGEHGVRVKTGDGGKHNVYWRHIHGHKKRAALAGRIVQSGEDGHIVVDDGGKRHFIAVPNEAREDPLVLKGGDKKGPPAGRAGLTQKVITEKSGKRNTHWVRTSKPEPGQRPEGKAEDQAPKGAPARGDRVKFKGGAGEIVGQPGKKGAHVRDAGGKVHKVTWAEMKPAGAAEPRKKPSYAARNEGESDKDYAKRAVDNQGEAPTKLPEQHDRYFNTEGAKRVDIQKLHSKKEDPEGDHNARRRMAAAYHGKLGKRDPITVMPHRDPKMAEQGHHEVIDGNGTYHAAAGLGWKNLPVNVVDQETGSAMLKDREAADLATQAVDPKKFAALPPKAAQPVATKDEILEKGREALDQLQDWLNRGTGVASKAGFTRMTKPPEDVTPEEFAKPGGMLFIAPLKSEERSAEKVKIDYAGDWSKLTDVVRCTLAVDSLHDMADIAKKLEASGMKLASRPKNKFLAPTPEGYRDINMIATMPNGMLAEVQLNVKDMLEAKNLAHPHYEVTRRIASENAGKAAEAWPPEALKTFQKAYAEQVRIYDEAWAEHVKTNYGNEPNMIQSGGGKK